MGRGPECISSNGLVPGDVPVRSNHVRGSGHEHAPDRSRYAESTEVTLAAGLLMETGWLVSGTEIPPFCAATARVVSSAFMECPQMWVDHDSWTNSESLGNAKNLLKKL